MDLINKYIVALSYLYIVLHNGKTTLVSEVRRVVVSGEKSDIGVERA